MELISFFIYFAFIPSTTIYENISFNENIDYCTNIIHDISREDEFLKNCDLEQTNKYIMIVKKGIN